MSALRFALSFVAAATGLVSCGLAPPSGSSPTPPTSQLNVSFPGTPVAGSTETISVATTMDVQNVSMFVEKAGGACGDPTLCPGSYDAHDLVLDGPRAAHLDYQLPAAPGTTVRFRLRALTMEGDSVLSDQYSMTTTDNSPPTAGQLTAVFSAMPPAGSNERIDVVSNVDVTSVTMWVEKPGGACGDPEACPASYDPLGLVLDGPRAAHLDYPVPSTPNTTVRFVFRATRSDGGDPFLSPPYALTTLDTQRSGQTYVVDRDHPQASDSNPGTEALPWRTIVHGARQVGIGDTLLVKAGVYHDGTVEVTNSGAPGQEIIISAWPGDERQAVLDGAGLRAIGKSYITVSGFKVQSSPDIGILFEGPDAEGIRIENCHLLNIVSSGVAIYGTKWGADPGNYDNIRDVVIDGNLFELVTNGGYNETITVTGGCVRVDVTHNILRLGPGLNGGIDNEKGDEGIDFKEGVRDSTIAYNVLTGLDHNAIYLDAGRGHSNWPQRPDPMLSNIEVIGNVVHDTRSNGITITSEGRGDVDGIVLMNNLVYRTEHNGYLVYGQVAGGNVRNVHFINNTAFDCGGDPNQYATGEYEFGGGFRVDNPNATGILFRNNIAWSNHDYDIRGEAETTLEANLARESGWTIQADPKFVNPGAGDFRLRSDSPAIDKGLPDGAPPIDKDGNPRPRGLGWDLGCLEYTP